MTKMMQRHLQYNAIVLRIRKVNNANAMVDFLVSDIGASPRESIRDGDEKLITAMCFGLGKTKKNYGLMQFQSGVLWLYFNPVNGNYKVTDFKPTAHRSSISESLVRLWCVSLATELAIKMHGNISFVLMTAFFDGIATASDQECTPAVLRFLWRLINEAGIAPDFNRCSICDSALYSCDENEIKALFPFVNFNVWESEVVCSHCKKPDGNHLNLSSESLQFLVTVQTLQPKFSRRIQPSEAAIIELKHFLFFLIGQMIKEPLKTLSMPII